MKMKLFWIMSSVFWIALIVAPLLYYADMLNFPVVAYRAVHKIVLVVLIFFPLVLFIISKLTKREKTVLIVFGVCIILNLLSFFTLTLFFTADEPFFYPVVSYTKSPDNYLILDKNLELKTEEDDYIFTVFPKEIPKDATDIEYVYYCDTAADVLRISAKWCVSNEEYEKEKERMSTQCIYNKYGNFFNFSENDFVLYIAFDDESKCVVCKYEQGSDLIIEELREEIESLKQKVNSQDSGRLA